MNSTKILLDKAITTLCSAIENEAHPSTVSPGLLWYNYVQYQITGELEYEQRTLHQVEAIVDLLLVQGYAPSVLLATKELDVTSELASKVELYKDHLLECTQDWLDTPNWDGLYRATEVGYYLAYQDVSSAKLNQWLTRYVSRSADSFFQQHIQAEPVFLLGVEGLTGILLMLEAVAHLTQELVLKEILQNGVYELLVFRQEVDFSAQQYAVFSRLANVAEQKSSWSNLLGWSGSDLMQALLFYRAADLLQDASLRKTADLIGLNTLLRKDQAGAIVDSPNFYHGTAGIAQCYQALYRASQQSAYQQGYNYWINETTQRLPIENNLILENHDLLNGGVGVALALLSCKYPTASKWEMVLL